MAPQLSQLGASIWKRANSALQVVGSALRWAIATPARSSKSTSTSPLPLDAPSACGWAVEEPSSGRGRYASEDFGRPFGRPRSGFNADADERAVIEAMEAADTIPEEFAGLQPGRRVRHAKFGPGKVVSISYDGTRTRAIVEFDRAGRKTLILEQAHLEPI